MWRGTQPLVAVIVGISLTEDSALARSEDAPAPAVTADETAAPAKAPAKVSSVPLPVTVFARHACVAGVV